MLTHIQKEWSDSCVSSEENTRQSSEIEISSKEDFGKIYEDLTASYVLTADIDLGGEVIEPIGPFEPKSDAPEDEEKPSALHISFRERDIRCPAVYNIRMRSACDPSNQKYPFHGIVQGFRREICRRCCGIFLWNDNGC